MYSLSKFNCIRPMCDAVIGTCRRASSITATGHEGFAISVDLDNIYSDPNRNPAQLFPRADVQAMLRSVSRFNSNKIFQADYVKELRSPTYQFMTDEEIRETERLSFERARARLLMPPVLPLITDEIETILDEPEIRGFETKPIIFTDISLGFTNRSRVIVVREPNGKLRTANRDERSRMNALWFPIRERQIDKPPMFDEENLSALCQRKSYKLILDRACLQFEPDEPEYLKTTAFVYEYVRTQADFESLRSTRHFGPMAFYYAYHGSADELLLDMLNSESIQEAADLVRLSLILSGRETELRATDGTSDNYTVIEYFIEKMSQRAHHLRVALNKHLDLERERRDANQTAKEAHGS